MTNEERFVEFMSMSNLATYTKSIDGDLVFVIFKIEPQEVADLFILFDDTDVHIDGMTNAEQGSLLGLKVYVAFEIDKCPPRYIEKV